MVSNLQHISIQRRWDDFRPVLQALPAAAGVPPLRLPVFRAPILDTEVCDCVLGGVKGVHPSGCMSFMRPSWTQECVFSCVCVCVCAHTRTHVHMGGVGKHAHVKLYEKGGGEY